MSLLPFILCPHLQSARVLMWVRSAPTMLFEICVLCRAVSFISKECIVTKVTQSVPEELLLVTEHRNNSILGGCFKNVTCSDQLPAGWNVCVLSPIQSAYVGDTSKLQHTCPLPVLPGHSFHSMVCLSTTADIL